ncbi:ribosomal protein S6 kinase-related protein-like [Gordionus sp. m RMFG-2023]|uniref:ribosomal protein S6 kinase-related protein-like n=1 Tax=Gordionus sp. m RMFG-2023 TaxID=3053472 RepID=UPI0031FDD5B1
MFVTEFHENGELHTLWATYRKFSEYLIKIYTFELSSAIKYLHESGIIYRDIKLENLLLDLNGHIRLTDFGLSKWLAIGEKTRTICGTLVYMAPEIVNEQAYGHECDWWSLGILVYAMFFGKFPIHGAEDHLQMRNKMRKYDYNQLPPFPAITKSSSDFIKRLISKDSATRTRNSAEITKHPFLTEFPDQKLNICNTDEWKSYPVWDFYHTPSHNTHDTPDKVNTKTEEKIESYTQKNIKYKSIAWANDNDLSKNNIDPYSFNISKRKNSLSNFAQITQPNLYSAIYAMNHRLSLNSFEELDNHDESYSPKHTISALNKDDFADFDYVSKDMLI